MTFTHALSTNNYGPRKFIVATSAANGTHTTLATAMAAASSGDTIELRDSVTENVTITPGVNITGPSGQAALNIPTITGTLTMTGAGTSTVSNIILKTNSATFVTVSGSAASILNIVNCYLNCSNNNGISYTSSSLSSAINISYCRGDIGTTGITLFTASGAGHIDIYFSRFTNTGGSTTASTISAGIFIGSYSDFNHVFSSSSTASWGAFNTNIDIGGLNVTPVTLDSSGTLNILQCRIGSGSASGITVTSGTCTISETLVHSTNTNAITGAGTIIYGEISFTNTSSTINTTTQTKRTVALGGLTFDGNTNALTTFTEGTYSPTVLGSGTAGTPTYTAQLGRYVQFNKRIFVYHVVIWSAISGSPTGNLLSGNLPFTSENTTNIANSFATMWGNNGVLISGAGNVPVMRVGANSTQLSALTYSQTVGGETALAVATSGSIGCEGWYTST